MGGPGASPARIKPHRRLVAREFLFSPLSAVLLLRGSEPFCAPINSQPDLFTLQSRSSTFPRFMATLTQLVQTAPVDTINKFIQVNLLFSPRFRAYIF
jgi:hypothetical protein